MDKLAKAELNSDAQLHNFYSKMEVQLFYCTDTNL